MRDRSFLHLLQSLSSVPIDFARAVYHRIVRLRLKNKTPTILSNNCIGGVVCHDLGLAFRSPTVNLFFSPEDFLTFAGDLRAFLEAEVEECHKEGVAYPIGTLTAGGKTITLNFLHYDSFEQAVIAWNRRKKRVNFDNVFVLCCFPTCTDDFLSGFDALPYERKHLITGENKAGSANVSVNSLYADPNATQRNILLYRGPRSVHRYMDEFDFVSFLNRGV